ncbi:MAG: response regulator [Polyangiaceae bacterium]|nr:response regulator [Polyangiaceae bacterium]
MARVLIVDAEESQRRALSAGLTVEGFDVAFAISTEGAMEILASPPSADVAMIDLMIPGLNGLDLARQIRGSFPNVRVVLSSAYHLSARQVERADCGAVGFVPKPYKVGELCSYLRSKARTVSPATC